MILQNHFIFPVFTASRNVVRKYAKGEEVFVKKKDKSNSTLSIGVLVQYDETVTMSQGRDSGRNVMDYAPTFGPCFDVSAS